MPEAITENLDLWSSALLTKSTAGRGSNGKLEAYGIKKLRELILELAVRGKLVQQGENWSDTCLGDLGSWAVGSGFTKSEQGKEGLEILFAKVSDMNLPDNTKYIVTTNHTITETTAMKLGVNVHATGTVIFPKIGGAIATNKRRILTRPTAIDNNCLGITPKAGVSTDWLYLTLSSINLTKYQAGTSVPALSQNVIAKIPVLLPPLAEQHRIVAKVDELMALCDQLEQQQTHSIETHQALVASLLGTLTRVESQQEFSTAWARIASHFDILFTTEASIEALKQTMLQLAVMGKLNNSSISKRVTLSELIELISGQHLLADEQNTEGRGIPYLTGPSDFGDKHPIPTRWTESPKVIAQPGDILVTVKGSGVGKTNKLVAGPIAISRQLMAVRVIGGNPDFIHLVLQHAAGHFQASMTGIAIPGIGRKDVLSLETNLPPLEEQQHIVVKVDELMALCDALKARLADAQAIQLHLADAIVEQAVC